MVQARAQATEQRKPGQEANASMKIERAVVAVQRGFNWDRLRASLSEAKSEKPALLNYASKGMNGILVYSCLMTRALYRRQRSEHRHATLRH